MNKKLQSLKEKENQLKAQIKNLEQIEKKNSQEKNQHINRLLGSCILQAVDDGFISPQVLQESIRRYSKTEKDKSILNGIIRP